MSRGLAGIFCIEGEWSSSMKRKGSVRPLLELLHDCVGIPFVHRNVATLDEFELYVTRWGQQQYRSFEIGYFAFHGSAGSLRIGHRQVSLDALGQLLRDRCARKIIYFGSCETIAVGKARINGFRRKTGARAVCGYNKEIGWIPSAAFDLTVFEALTHYKRIDAAERYLRRECSGLMRSLGFRLYFGR